MNLKKQFFLPILLSLSVFFTSSVVLPATTYASVMPQVQVVRQLAEDRIAAGEPVKLCRETAALQEQQAMKNGRTEG